MIQKKTQKNNEKINHQKKKPPQRITSKEKPEEPSQRVLLPEPVCKRCGKPIKDIAFALSDKTSKDPIHFECVLNFLKESEQLQKNEEILYIGSGNFAIVYFENPGVRKHFKIKKLIEWEAEGNTHEWRQTIAKLTTST